MAMEWLYGDLQRTRRTRPWFDSAIWSVIAILATNLHHLLDYGNLGARQIGCPYRIVLRWRPGQAAYEADLSISSYNYGPSLDPKAYPVHRHRELLSSSTNTSQPRSGPYSTSTINSLHNPAIDTINDLS